MSPQATEEVSYRYAVRSERRRSATKITSPVIRLAGDAGCHPPLQGRDFTRSPFRWTQKRDEFHSQVLPLEGKVSPQATEEVSYRKAVSFDGCKSGTSSTQSFPLRGRCRRRRRKRCRTGSQVVSTDAEAERKSPLPSSGLRETPDATLPSRGGILRAARSDGRKTGTSSAPKSFPSRGRCRRRRRKRCRTGSQFLSTNAKAERGSPLPSSGLRETPDATLPSRGGILRVDLFPFPDEPCRSPSAFRRTELLLKNGKQFLNYRNILLTNDMKSAMVKKNRPEGSP